VIRESEDLPGAFIAVVPRKRAGPHFGMKKLGAILEATLPRIARVSSSCPTI
jgi:hypothetical protein